MYIYSGILYAAVVYKLHICCARYCHDDDDLLRRFLSYSDI